VTESYLRFADLKRMGIVNNWQTLKRWIRDQSFPPGIMLGGNTRAWREDEIEAWLASRPIAGGRQDGDSRPKAEREE
jgi:predicted DNA-binding transcriptional regulator AlpA